MIQIRKKNYYLLRIIYFANYKHHALCLSIKCLYFEHFASAMFDVSNKFVPNKILNLLKKIPDIHIYSTQAVIVQKKLFKLLKY